MNNMCKFYVDTARGRRCILLDYKEWRMRRNKLVNMCENGGSGCTILSKYFRIASRSAKMRSGLM